MKGIRGRVAIVTGAGRGIGQGAALALAEEGADLVVNDLEQGPLDETVRQIEALGGRAAALAGSVAERGIGERLAKLALERFGDIHIAVTAAGYTWDGMTHRVTDEQWQSIIDVHLTGTFYVVRDAFKVMRDKAREAQERGETPLPRHIVTISSMSGFGNLGQVNYAAAKAGIAGLTRTVALEGAMFNILANSLAYGPIDTRLTRPREAQEERIGEAVLGIPTAHRDKHVESLPMKRVGTVEEAVGPILFLASDLANYTSGALLEVNGAAHIS
ncbi:MAG: SDR family oxidoreductase [Dehalococcoidia bacterium]